MSLLLDLKLPSLSITWVNFFVLRLRYLKGTIHLILQYYSSGSLDLECFFDADWVANRDDRKSIVGYCV